MLVPDYALDFLNGLLNDERKLSTVKRYSADLNLFFSWLNGYKNDISLKSIKSLTSEDLVAYITYLAEQKYSDATVRRLTTVLNRLFIHLNINAPHIQKLSSVAGIRKLHDKDFVSDEEMSILLHSMRIPGGANNPLAAARNLLINRNVSIVTLLRYYGLTPSDIFSIDMNSVNFGQNEITFHPGGKTRKLTLSTDHKKLILKYLQEIPILLRPKYHTNDPLFVAFNNTSLSFQFDYIEGKPKRFAIRSIQEMLKDEVKRAGLRKISATNLRNTAILDFLLHSSTDMEVVTYFGLSNPFSIRRYKIHLDSLKNVNEE